MEHNAVKRKSFEHTDLIIACKTRNVAAVREILEWRDDDGKRLDISARDENGQTALSFAKQSNNEEIVTIIQQHLFLRAVENGDFDTVKTYLYFQESDLEVLYSREETDILTDHYEHNSEREKSGCKREDINARDEILRAALSIAKQINDEELVAIIEQNLFLRSVESEDGDIETGKTRLSSEDSNFEVLYRREDRNDILKDRHEHSSEQMEIQSHEVGRTEESPLERLKEGFEVQFTSKDTITYSVWLEAVTIAQHTSQYEMLKLLFNDDRFINGFNENGQTIFHQNVAEYLAADKNDFGKLEAIKILLKSKKLNANALNLQNETIFEIICKKDSDKIHYLLRVLLQNGIDFNGGNENGETLLMLSCKNRRTVMVRSLLEFAASDFVLDIDAVDNSGETALMKAKERNFWEIVVALLGFKLILAVEDENVDNVKSILDVFRNNQYLFDMTTTQETKSAIWKAMWNVMEKKTKRSQEILILLDCDSLFSQEIETSYSLFNKLTRGFKVYDDKRLRLTELLLKSGKINLNARDEYGSTSLHRAKGDKLISLLIRYGADVSRKDNEGKTPLMPNSDMPDIQRIPVLRALLKEAGTLGNLDAMDYSGRTALMHAVMLHRSQDVELLLNAGASVNLSDHLGFTALHHALHGHIDGHFEFPKNSEELKKIKEMAAESHENCSLYVRNEKRGMEIERCDWLRSNKEWNAKSFEIIEMLLQRADIDVNALSFEKFSPLDIAEGWIPQIPSSTKDALKKKGAIFNIFRHTESQSTSDFHLDLTCKVTWQQLFKKVNVNATEDMRFLLDRLQDFIKTFKEQIASYKDQQGRTTLHLFAIFSNYSGNLRNDTVWVLTETIVDELISIGCSVNELDNFGRTPLHYASEMFWDKSIEDKDGNIAIDRTSQESSDEASYIVYEITERNDKTYLLRLMNNQQMEINVQCVDGGHRHSDSVPEFCREEVDLKTAPVLLWEKCKYAFRHPLVKQITKEVTDLMSAIAKEIERLDPRFEIKPEFVGSSNEGTKRKMPDEFDFCFVLTKISEFCDVSQSPELPTGFVHLKRRPKKAGETNDFDSFFGKHGILSTANLNWQFAIILRNAIINIEREENFRWILEFTFKNKSGPISENITKVANIHMTNPLNFFAVDHISVDIVPCIHIDGWWPDDAISNVSDEIKEFGCNLIFDSPQKLYPWVPYSESCARISFSKAESDTVKQSCQNAKEAYMIAKTMIEHSSKGLCGYTLKNCLLYCIEALSPSSEKASQLGLSLGEMESKFHQMDRYLWLRCLMKCNLEFVAQNFCPCYFLPTFSSFSVPVEADGYLKKGTSGWIAGRKSNFPQSCKKACVFYHCTLDDISECSYQLPAPDPLWERFDRKQLITSLRETAYK